MHDFCKHLRNIPLVFIKCFGLIRNSILIKNFDINSNMFSDLQTEHTQLLYDEGTYQALVDHRRVGNTNNSSRELDLKTYDAAFLIMSILFIFIGSCGVFANGRSLCLFFPTDIVSQILLKILLFSHYYVKNGLNIECLYVLFRSEIA